MRTGSTDAGPAPGDDRMYVLEVNRVVVEDVTDEMPVSFTTPAVQFRHAAWTPFRPPEAEDVPMTASIVVPSEVRPEEGVSWCVVTRENTPRFQILRVEPFARREDAIAHLENVEPLCPLRSLNGEPRRPPTSISEYRAWVAANGWTPSYVAPEPESDVGVHALPEPFEIPGELERLLYWRLSPGITRHMVESGVRQLLRAGTHAAPWAVVALDRPYRLIGLFLSERGTPADMIALTDNPSPARRTNPRLKAMLVFRKSALEAAAERCELFRPASELLADRPENGSWLCLPEPPEEEWTRRHEAADDDLFATVRHRAMGAG